MCNAGHQNPQGSHLFALNELLFKQPLLGDVIDAHEHIICGAVFGFDRVNVNAFESVRIRETCTLEHRAVAAG